VTLPESDHNVIGQSSNVVPDVDFVADWYELAVCSKHFSKVPTKPGQAPLKVTFLNRFRLSAGASPGFVTRS
jgi:hypothetical protein